MVDLVMVTSQLYMGEPAYSIYAWVNFLVRYKLVQLNLLLSVVKLVH